MILLGDLLIGRRQQPVMRQNCYTMDICRTDSRVVLGGVCKRYRKAGKFLQAFAENNTIAIEKGFNDYLWNTISICDISVKKEMKENFYHGILLRLLAYMDGWLVKSNAESGEGYSDISIEIRQRETGIIIELKYAENGTFDAGCQEALKQIKDRRYENILIDNGMRTIYQYGLRAIKNDVK